MSEIGAFYGSVPVGIRIIKGKMDKVERAKKRYVGTCACSRQRPVDATCASYLQSIDLGSKDRYSSTKAKIDDSQESKV
jgi:hypothetical protein